jgi:hypothetical protein
MTIERIMREKVACFGVCVKNMIWRVSMCKKYGVGVNRLNQGAKEKFATLNTDHE